jgi:hypothetical protein
LGSDKEFVERGMPELLFIIGTCFSIGTIEEYPYCLEIKRIRKDIIDVHIFDSNEFT